MSRSDISLYVTQGKVQMEFKADGNILVRINPIQDYSVKHNGKAFTIFVHYDPKEKESELAAKIFDATYSFAVDDKFLTALLEAATKEIKIEITIEGSNPSIIKSLKIPATL